MSKKQKNKGRKEPEYRSSFDFSTLLTYCSSHERETFLTELKNPPVSGLVLNEEIYPENHFKKDFPTLEKDTKDPLLYRFKKTEESMGKTIEHFSGGFYILDPSSSLISYYLQDLLRRDFLCLDLCAAPGGKTICLNLRRKDGLFLANDIAYDRAIEISKNAQRLSLSNILTLSIDPQKLSLPAMFDLLILDVPCSGSGMIRKEPKMASDWSLEKVERLLPIQEQLLEKAYELTKKDGLIAYSTCSLSTAEDEEQIEKFLSRHKDMELLSFDVDSSVIKGLHNIGYHMVPGLYQGEGIYFAILRKKEGDCYIPTYSKNLKPSDIPSLYSLPYKDNEYLLPRFYQEFASLPFLSPGMKKMDTSPHPKCQYDHAYSKIATDLPLIPVDRNQALEYIKGNEVKLTSSEEGLVILTYQNMRLGFGKNVQGKVKNYLPKGLRNYSIE